VNCSEKPTFIRQSSEKPAFLVRLAVARVIRALPAPAPWLSGVRPLFFRFPRFRFFSALPLAAIARLGAAPFFPSPFGIALCSPLTRRFFPASTDLSYCVLLSFLRSGGTLRRSPGLRLAPVSPLAEVVRDMGAPRGFSGMAEGAALPLGQGADWVRVVARPVAGIGIR
jgi:hypothetical protein